MQHEARLQEEQKLQATKDEKKSNKKQQKKNKKDEEAEKQETKESEELDLGIFDQDNLANIVPVTTSFKLIV